MPVSTPTITSNGGLATAAISLNEGITAVTTVVGNDLDGDALSYSLVGGTDRFKFNINATTGVLTFKAPPDFELPTDTDENGALPGGRNTYQVIVRVSDGDLFDTQTITVTIGNVDPVTITGDDFDNILGATATVEGDTLNGLGGNDTLNGGAGADTMNGGDGNDRYFVDNVGDVVVEGASTGGNDTVISSVTYKITDAAVENLTLTGTAALNATGNASANILTGNDGANILDGISGIDTMIGGKGNDVYKTDGGDTITELSTAGSGTDRVESSATVAALAANVENLTLTGALAINGTGNALNNIIIGNAAVNTLSGGDGNDTLDGDGSLLVNGADALTGGKGNDIYIVDNIGDTVTEVAAVGETAATQGIDRIHSSVTFDLANAVNVENLTLTGITAINGSGAGGANIIIGNSAANFLSGGNGADTLNGGAGLDSFNGGNGNDIIIVDNVAETVDGGADTDTIKSSVSFSLAAVGVLNVENLTLTGTANTATGNALDNKLTGNGAANILIGNDGADTLDGLLGVDHMTGGNGNDTYVVTVAGEVTVEDSVVGSGTDTVKSSVTWTLATNVENLTLTGLSAVNGTGNVSDNVITGNGAVNILTGLDGNDTLDGGLGIDTMIGGAGNDTYHVAQADVVTEVAGAGTDTVISTLSGVAGYTLALNVENLTLGGNASINGTGNGGDNVITGNNGFNVLNGGIGADTINGAGGADTINGGDGVDVMTGGTAIDTFVFTALGEGNGDSIMDFVNLEHITLTEIDARADLLTNQAFIMDTNGIGVAGEIMVSAKSLGNVVTVSLFTDGVAGADMVFSVNIGALTTLVASDFDL